MLTKEQKIEVLKHLIETRQTAVTQRGNDELVAQAQQWLADLESGGDGWVRVEDALPETYSRVLCYNLDAALICLGTAIWNGEKFLFDATLISRMSIFEKVSDRPVKVTHWRPITPPKIEK